MKRYLVVIVLLALIGCAKKMPAELPPCPADFRWDDAEMRCWVMPELLEECECPVWMNTE